MVHGAAVCAYLSTFVHVSPHGRLRLMSDIPQDLPYFIKHGSSQRCGLAGLRAPDVLLSPVPLTRISSTANTWIFI